MASIPLCQLYVPSDMLAPFNASSRWIPAAMGSPTIAHRSLERKLGTAVVHLFRRKLCPRLLNTTAALANKAILGLFGLAAIAWVRS
jgi:hypothetical protein